MGSGRKVNEKKRKKAKTELSLPFPSSLTLLVTAIDACVCNTLASGRLEEIERREARIDSVAEACCSFHHRRRCTCVRFHLIRSSQNRPYLSRDFRRLNGDFRRLNREFRSLNRDFHSLSTVSLFSTIYATTVFLIVRE